jgi:hypothetical protein
MYAHIHKSISTTCMHSYTITNPYLQHVCTHTQFHIHNIYAHIHAYTSTTCMHTYSHTHLQHVISGFFDVLFRFCFRSRWLCNWCKVCREGVLCCRVVHTHTHTHTHTHLLCKDLHPVPAHANISGLPSPWLWSCLRELALGANLRSPGDYLVLVKT